MQLFKKTNNNTYGWKKAYYLITFLVPLVYVLINFGRICGPFFPPDEFGYWNNVGRWLGLDWSGASFNQSFYAYGYSLLLYPFARFLNDPLSMYRGALIMNALLFFAQAAVLYSLVDELTWDDKDTDKKLSAPFMFAVCLSGAFYPAHFVYMNYTICESLLYVLLPLSFLFLVRYEKSRRPQYAVLAVAVSVMLVFTHFRTIGVFITMIVAVIIVARRNKGERFEFRRLISVGVILAVAAAGVVALSLTHFKTGFRYIDDQLVRLSSIISVHGILSFMMGIAGKFLYVIIASLGLLFLYLRWVKHNRKSISQMAFAASLIISIIISAMFFVNTTWTDCLVYGRYTEIFLPVVVCLGMVELNYGGLSFDHAVKNSFITALISAVVLFYAITNSVNIYMRDFIIGMTWMFGNKTPAINMLFAVPTIVCAVFIWLYYGLGRMQNRMVLKSFAPILVLMIFAYAGITMSEKCSYRLHDVDRSDLTMFEEVSEEYDKGRSILFIRCPWTNYVGHLQFFMFDRPMTYLEGDLEGGNGEAPPTAPDDMVITYPNYEHADQLKERYAHVEKTAHFVMYSN